MSERKHEPEPDERARSVPSDKRSEHERRDPERLYRAILAALERGVDARGER